MQSKINTSFLQSLIKFDFFFSNSKKLPKNLNPFLKTTKTISSKSYKFATVFSPDFLLKEFKQFLRVIQFLKKQNIKISLINTKDFLFFNTFKLICFKTNIDKNFFWADKKNKLNANFIKTCFFSFRKLSVSFYKKLYNSLNYLSIEFLLYLKKNDFGSYSVLININSWKKLVFLFLIFSSVYKK